MKPITASSILLLVIILCGYLVANSPGIYKIASFILGILATFMIIYLNWKTRNEKHL